MRNISWVGQRLEIYRVRRSSAVGLTESIGPLGQQLFMFNVGIRGSRARDGRSIMVGSIMVRDFHLHFSVG